MDILIPMLETELITWANGIEYHISSNPDRKMSARKSHKPSNDLTWRVSDSRGYNIARVDRVIKIYHLSKSIKDELAK